MVQQSVLCAGLIRTEQVENFLCAEHSHLPGDDGLVLCSSVTLEVRKELSLNSAVMCGSGTDWW